MILLPNTKFKHRQLGFIYHLENYRRIISPKIELLNLGRLTTDVGRVIRPSDVGQRVIDDTSPAECCCIDCSLLCSSDNEDQLAGCPTTITAVATNGGRSCCDDVNQTYVATIGGAPFFNAAWYGPNPVVGGGLGHIVFGCVPLAPTPTWRMQVTAACAGVGNGITYTADRPRKCLCPPLDTWTLALDPASCTGAVGAPATMTVVLS